jgi:hypothetical protein
MVEDTRFETYGVDVIFSDMTSLLNFIKIYEFVQSYWGVGHKTDEQTAW